MEISPEGNGKHAAKASSRASTASFSGSKIAKLPVIGGHSRFNPSVTSSMHTVYKKVKFMCSSSGKILPRPSDMKLRYVGGETRVVSLPRDINYEDFSRKMVELYGPDIILKYQLPEEDLDALVSVSSDEDLENMMEECDRLSAGDGSSKLRAFIFLASELDVQVLDEIANFKSSERKFVDALNAVLGDALPVSHSTGKLYPTSDSFNDAYKAWNGIHSQDKDSYFSANPYSEAPPLGDYVSSGDLNPYESFVPDHLQSSTSPFSHSAFMGQPVLSHTLGVPHLFKDDLSSGTWRDSPSFFGQGIGHSYGGSHWLTSSEMSVPTQFTVDEKSQNKMYEVDQSFGELSRGNHGNVQNAQDYVKYYRKADKISKADESSVSDTALPNASSDDQKGQVSGDTLKRSVGQLQSDSLVLSPGALLQKQLMSSPSTVAPSQKHFYSDWPSDELSASVTRQSYSIMSGVESQPEAFTDHVLQERWEKLPMYESSFGLSQQNHVFENVDDQSFGVQLSTASEGLPFSIENSGAIFRANTSPSSPPSSPSEWKPQLENTSENVLTGEGSGITSIASVPPADGRAPLISSAQVSATFVSSAKPAAEIVQIHTRSTPDQSFRQDTCNFDQILSTEEPNTILRVDQEASIMDMSQLKASLHLVKGAVSLPNSSDDEINKPIAIQSDELTDQFSVLIDHQRSEGSSLPTETNFPSQLITTAVHQRKNDPVDSFSTVEEVALPAMIDGSHRLDMLSELFGSTGLTNCLAATSSGSERFRSRSESSVDGKMHYEEGENPNAMVREESLCTGNESPDFPLPTQEDFPSFQTTKNSLPPNEQLDRVLLPVFPTDFDDENTIFADATSLRNTDTVSNPYSSQVPNFASLIESWEANLLQDEDEQHQVEHVMQEHVQEHIGVSPTFDKEIELEDPRVEFEEVEEVRLMDYGPMNAAAIAEQEAISRGLQIIRNSDLEELRELGSGTFGTVYHGKWRGSDVAIKRIKASCFAGRQAERDRLVADFWREAYILGQLHHPNVVAFYGVVPDGPGATLATVTEYMVNGSLKQVLQNKDRTLDRRKRLLIAMDAAFGMEYLHGKNVVHFDIKCENLLVNLRDAQRPVCKVGDLGLSKVKQQTFVSGGVRGTLPWMAPELLNGSSSLVSEKVDVFSFGIVMWELLTGEEPYAHMHYGAIIGGIVNNTLRPTVPRWCDPAWRSLMEKCWAADPNERPTFLEIARVLRAMEASLAAKGPGQSRILEMYQ